MFDEHITGIGLSDWLLDWQEHPNRFENDVIKDFLHFVIRVSFLCLEINTKRLVVDAVEKQGA